MGLLDWIFFVKCARFEVQHGLINHCIETYDKMVDFVEEPQRMTLYKFYIARVAELLGLTASRSVFEKGLTVLKETQKVPWGLGFIEIEKKLGEIDRARQIYSYLAQFCEPLIEEYGFW